MPHTMPDIQANLHRVQVRIEHAARAAGRDAGSVTLVAVSKTQPAEAVRAAYDAGQRIFGESYVQEAVAKMQALSDLTLQWHFIGPVQSNKTKEIARHFDWVHGIDRFKVAERLSAQRPSGFRALDVCIQVNTSGEASKSGVALDQLPALAHAVAALPGLRLRGLMTVPAPQTDPDAQRRPFRALRGACERLHDAGLELDTLSMGMSGDLEAAVLEGATMVRIGTAIFGQRPRPPASR